MCIYEYKIDPTALGPRALPSCPGGLFPWSPRSARNPLRSDSMAGGRKRCVDHFLLQIIVKSTPLSNHSFRPFSVPTVRLPLFSAPVSNAAGFAEVMGALPSVGGDRTNPGPAAPRLEPLNMPHRRPEATLWEALGNMSKAR